MKNTETKRLHKMRKWDIAFITVMLAIPIAHFIVFYLVVNVNSFLMAFQLPTGAWSMFSFQNAWYNLTTGGSVMQTALKNTAIYFVKDMLMMPFNLLVAYLFWRKLRGYRVFRILLYMPGIISGVAIATMFSSFIAPTGPIGKILESMGVDPIPEFLANSDYATWTILFYTIWLGWGGNMLLFGGALARIPIEIVESARLDGIGSLKEFIFIVFPLVWTTYSTLLILSLTGIFGASGPILLFTKGNHDTMTLGYWIFDKIKYVGPSAYNEVAATGMILTVIGVPVIMFLRWLIERIPTVEY